MSDTDFIAAHYMASHTAMAEPRTPHTIFDDFEPAFMILEYLATAAFLSEVFCALERVVVAWYPTYHTCRNQDG